MEAELKVIADFISWWMIRSFFTYTIFGKQTGTEGWTKLWVKVQWCAVRSVFLAKNSLHNQDICNKFIEVNFCVGCMVSRQGWTFVKYWWDVRSSGTRELSNKPLSGAYLVTIFKAFLIKYRAPLAKICFGVPDITYSEWSIWSETLD